MSEILIVGAGPTGLNLALRLARHGVSFRIIDRNAGPGLASRAMVVHARTLEFYDQLGFGADVIANGVPIRRIHVREEGEEVATVAFTDLGGDLSPHPFVLCFPQDDHERFLVAELEAAGVKVEWNTELLTLYGTQAALRHAGTTETVTPRYVCGCDGAHSAVRQALALEFPGGTYEQTFFVADVKLAQASSDDLFVNVTKGGFVLMLPVRSSGMRRFIGTIPLALGEHPDLDFGALRPHVESVLGVRVEEVNWFSTYRVHHRVASQFRVGNVFLAGDAAHIHSPAGGQGMNTGIGDAVNLSWKLANVLQGRMAESVLDTYEAERIAFARKLVETTDRLFQSLVHSGLRGKVLRSWLIPVLAPLLTDLAVVRRAVFQAVSQIRIDYRKSALSEGSTGRIQGGDRLPWAGDNFAALQSLDWQVHVHGNVSPEIAKEAVGLKLPVHAFSFTPAAARAGLAENAAYLVRPDGHVALAGARSLTDYARRIGLSAAGAGARSRRAGE